MAFLFQLTLPHCLTRLHPPQVASVYQRVPYHNFQHCVDVTHTTFMFIKWGWGVCMGSVQRKGLRGRAHPNSSLLNAPTPPCPPPQPPPAKHNRRVAHKVALSELEKFALMVAALSHDLDHPGESAAHAAAARGATVLASMQQTPPSMLPPPLPPCHNFSTCCSSSDPAQA